MGDASLSTRLNQLAYDLEEMAGLLRMAGTVAFGETPISRIVDVKAIDRASLLNGMAMRCRSWAREMVRG